MHPFNITYPLEDDKITLEGIQEDRVIRQAEPYPIFPVTQ